VGEWSGPGLVRARGRKIFELGCGGGPLGGFNVGAMTNTTISKHARQAARKAAAAAAEELAARNRANVEDLATFFNAHERADGVDEWLAERQAALEEQARQRRSGFVRDGGLALRAMRVRGESVREIAAMTGLTEKGVRDAIRAAEAIVPVPAAGSSRLTVEELKATPAAS
jgi:hypothetical protein